MKRFFFIILLLIYCQGSFSADRFPNLNKYMESVPSDSAKAWRSVVADREGMRFGIARSSRSAFVFVLKTYKDDSVEEVARTKVFDYDDPGDKTHITSIDALSTERFSIQIHYQNACNTEVTFDIYRFAKKANNWYLSGLDSSRCQWASPPEIGGGARTERSANFLTGQISEKTFKKNRLVKTMNSHRAYSPFLLVDFEVFDEKYGPR
jgi:hypothetical protein